MRILKRFPVQLILGSALFLLVTLLCVTTLVGNRYQTAMVEQSERQTLRAFEQAETKITQKLYAARSKAAMLLRKGEITDYLFRHFEKDSQHVVALIEVLNVLSETVTYSDDLNGLWFLREDGAMVGATATWRFAYEETAHPIFASASLDTTAQWDSVTWLGGWWLEELTGYPPRAGDSSKLTDDVMILGVLRSRYHTEQTGSRQTVYTLFSVGESAIRECLGLLADEGGDLYLLDGGGHQIIGPVLESMKQTPWFYSSLPPEQTTGGMELTHEGRAYQLVHHTIGSTGWTLVKQIPLESYTGEVSRLRRTTLLIGLGVMLLAMAAYTLWVLRFIRPFQAISATLEQVRQGNLDVQLCYSSNVYEFELMRGEFNSMIQSIQALLARTKAMEHERMALELRNLQSQLNPHMVFNSMTAIRWMATMSGADKVSDMLVELAELIRPIFSEWRLVWTLQDEINYVGHYLKLLTLRFGGLIQSEIYLSETLMAVSLPCFTLQPLLENSAEHGMRDGQVLTITIEGMQLDDGRVQLRVWDNGRGMPQHKLDALRQKMKSADSSEPEGGIGHTGIGLINIYRRLQMFDPEACDMRIDSADQAGVSITLWLPGLPKNGHS